MRNIRLYISVVVVATVGSLLSTSCDKNVFDQQVYENIVERSFPTDTVDSHHDWQLSVIATTHISCDVAGTWRVALLSANPQEQSQAEILAEQYVTAGENAMLTYLLPKVQQQMWGVAYDATGQLLALQELTAGNPSCRLTEADVPATTGSKQLSRQRVYYLYESEFPKPGDWDFNDLVLTIETPQPVPPGSTDDSELAARQVRLHVTLEAVGCNLQLAAAIRFVGIKFSEVESITTEGNLSFVRNSTYPRSIITDDALLQQGRNGDAVLCLFDDAHLAVYSRTSESGMVFRYYYNVSHTTSDVYHIFNAPEVTYLITFRDAQTARLFSAASLDPFIISPFNGANWEIHQYQYRMQQTMFEYVTEDQGNFHTGYSWCLSVPYSWFRYAIEKNPLGTLKNGVISGAYSVFGHSYGQWVADRNTATDWYLYPSSRMVY